MKQPDLQAVEIRTYTAASQAEANKLFQADANALAATGYRPTSQTWTPPGRSRIFATALILLITGWFLGALTIGAIYGFGIAAVGSAVYVMYTSPRAVGSLSVTYTR